MAAAALLSNGNTMDAEAAAAFPPLSQHGGGIIGNPSLSLSSVSRECYIIIYTSTEPEMILFSVYRIINKLNDYLIGLK